MDRISYEQWFLENLMDRIAGTGECIHPVGDHCMDHSIGLYWDGEVHHLVDEYTDVIINNIVYDDMDALHDRCMHLLSCIM